MKVSWMNGEDGKSMSWFSFKDKEFQGFGSITRTIADLLLNAFVLRVAQMWGIKAIADISALPPKGLPHHAKREDKAMFAPTNLRRGHAAALIWIVCGVFFTGCETIPTDFTDNPQARSEQGRVELKVDVQKGLLVITSTVQPYVFLGGGWHPMEGQGVGEWRYYHDAPCVGQLDYRFKVQARYLPVPLPIPLPSPESYAPEQGVATLSITHGLETVFSPDPEIIIACVMASENCIGIVKVKNISVSSPLTVEDVTIGPCTSDCLTVGLPTGQGFYFDDKPPLPQSLLCGGELDIPIRVHRAQGNTIQGGELSILYTRGGATLTKRIRLSGHVFPPL